MSTNTKFPEPFSIEQGKTKNYLNELVRALRDFDNNIFSQQTGVLYSTARKTPFLAISSAYEMGPRDCVILADSSSGSITITGPDALQSKGMFYHVKKTDTNAATVVSVECSSDEGVIVLSGTGRPSVTVFSDGENFWSF